MVVVVVVVLIVVVAEGSDTAGNELTLLKISKIQRINLISVNYSFTVRSRILESQKLKIVPAAQKKIHKRIDKTFYFIFVLSDFVFVVRENV